MKSFVTLLAGLMVFSVTAYAQPTAPPASSGDALPEKSMTMCDGKMDTMCPMMGVNREVIDVLKMQQKLASGGVSSAGKKTLAKQIDRKLAGLDSMMTSMKSMSMPCMKSQMSCPQQGAPGAMQDMPGMAAPKK